MLEDLGTNEFAGHEPCPQCGSKDNLARYADGHGYCFGCGHYESSASDNSEVPVASIEEEKIIIGEVRALSKRQLTEETCKKWNYQVGTFGGRPVQIANYTQDGRIVGQKLRFPDKTFVYRDYGSKHVLFGQHLWKEGGKKLVITEGEIDALTVSQLQNHKWPVVSIPHGSKSAKKTVKKNIEWIETFDDVIFMFDMDEPGQTAAREAALVLTPGRAKIAVLPMKDPNACLTAGQGDQVIQAIWNAKTYRPDGIVSGSETWDMVSKIMNVDSTPYPWAHMNEKSFGMRAGEIVLVTAGSGIGKSSLCREIAYYLFNNLNETVGYIGLEESVAQTARAFMSLEAGVPLHLKPKAVPEAEQQDVWKKVLNHERIQLYDHWGSVDSDTLLAKLRYMAKGCGCKWLFLDHISIMISGGSLEADERRTIDKAMTNFRSFVEEAQVGLFIVSHLKKPGNGKPFEEGGQISLSDLRGSGALYQLSDLVVGLERDQQDDLEQNTTRVRWLKNRFSGMTGISGLLFYDPDSGRMMDDEGRVSTDCPFEASPPVAGKTVRAVADY